MGRLECGQTGMDQLIGNIGHGILWGINYTNYLMLPFFLNNGRDTIYIYDNIN